MKSLFDKNSVWFGLAVGTFSPLLLTALLYAIDYYLTLWLNPVLIQAYNRPYVTLWGVALIAIFFNIVFFRKYLKAEEYEMTGRGIMVITMVLTLVVVLLKLNVLMG